MSDLVEYKPILKLNPVQISAIQSVYPILKSVQTSAQIDWRILAAVWMRETGRFSFPVDKGGPFQFDPVPNYERFTKLLRYSHLSSKDIDLFVEAGVGNFTTAATLAGCLMRSLVPWVKWEQGKPTDDRDVIDAFYKYNGAAYGSPYKSPYVFNGYNENYKDMVVRGTINGKWIEKVDKNPGAFASYKQLTHLFP